MCIVALALTGIRGTANGVYLARGLEPDGHAGATPLEKRAHAILKRRRARPSPAPARRHRSVNHPKSAKRATGRLGGVSSDEASLSLCLSLSRLWWQRPEARAVRPDPAPMRLARACVARHTLRLGSLLSTSTRQLFSSSLCCETVRRETSQAAGESEGERAAAPSSSTQHSLPRWRTELVKVGAKDARPPSHASLPPARSPGA